jgi:hypothetical protein
MPPVIGTVTASAWSSGGALLTFFFPAALFVVIAAALYLEFTRPHAVPGLAAVKPAPAPQAQAAGTAHNHEQPVGDSQ